MKYSIKNNNIVVEAETVRDNFTLTKLMTNLPEKKESMELVEPKQKKHKRHMYLKTCDRCGGKFKGRIGLGIHQAKCSAKKKERLNERITLTDAETETDEEFFGAPVK